MKNLYVAIVAALLLILVGLSLRTTKAANAEQALIHDGPNLRIVLTEEKCDVKGALDVIKPEFHNDFRKGAVQWKNGKPSAWLCWDKQQATTTGITDLVVDDGSIVPGVPIALFNAERL